MSLQQSDIMIGPVRDWFRERNLDCAFIVPTGVGMAKSIMDATEEVRSFFKWNRIHDFDSQHQGREHKKTVFCLVVSGTEDQASSISLYRPRTKQGDPRIWISGLRRLAQPWNLLCLVYTDTSLIVVNASLPGSLDQLARIRDVEPGGRKITNRSTGADRPLELLSTKNRILRECESVLRAQGIPVPLSLLHHTVQNRVTFLFSKDELQVLLGTANNMVVTARSMVKLSESGT